MTPIPSPVQAFKGANDPRPDSPDCKQELAGTESVDPTAGASDLEVEVLSAAAETIQVGCAMSGVW